MNNTEKRAAIVTGASRGIGREVARGLCGEGYPVVLVSRNEAQLQQLKEELVSEFCSANRVLTCVGTVSDLDFVQALVRDAETRFGGVDILFNNAGINHQGTSDLAPEKVRELFEINTIGAWNLLHAVTPVMKRQRSGAIFNLTSICGEHAFPGVGAYSASKFALRAFSEALFHELVPLGIRVTDLAPSWVNTEMARHSKLPAQAMIQAEDILKAIQFVLSLSPGAHIERMTIQCGSDLA